MPGSASDKPVSLATQLRLIQLEVGKTEQKNVHLQHMVDVALEMYNSLMEWSVNTEHEAAAVEIQKILEEHMQEARVRVQVPQGHQTSLTRVGHL